MIHYAEGSEYDYLSWSAYQEKRRLEKDVLEPLENRYWQAYCSGDRPLASQLWEQCYQLRCDLSEQHRRREDILYWLYLDSQLRTEGTTYPDVYESEPDQVCDVTNF